MSSAKAPRFWKLLAFRLTVLYGGVLVASAVLCFSISYFLVSSAMQSRTDADLLREAGRCATAFHDGGLAALQQRIDVDAPAIGTNDVFFIAYDRSSTQLASSDLSSWSDAGFPSPQAPKNGPRFQDASGSGHHGRLRVLSYPMDGNVIQVGITIQDDVRVMEEARRIAGLLMLGLIGIAVVVGWFLAKRALSGVQQVTSTANEISRGALARRVPTSGSGDEMDELATTINRMLGRIQALVEDMQATNDNIAHELRSPITRMRGLAETTLTGESSATDYQEMAASTIEECDRLLAIINTMLDIAEAEAGVTKLDIAPFDVVQVVEEAYEFYEPMTSEKGIGVRLEVPKSATAVGDLKKIQRVVANLLDNAVKYTPAGGAIALSVARENSTIRVGVSNSGPTILPKDLPHIFKRFYRASAGRSGPGYGLGLSLAQAIVQAHGSRIDVTSEAGAPTTFTLTLPAAADGGGDITKK